MNAAPERQWLTVVFVDLVDSASLAMEMEPEDYRDLIEDLQKICLSAFQDYLGRALGWGGEAIMGTFGFPEALEYHAQAGLKAALQVVEQVNGKKEWKARLPSGQTPQVRVGVHSGLIVVGGFGRGMAVDSVAVVGAVAKIGRRIQELAGPNQIVASQDTLALMRDEFEVSDLGDQTIQGLKDTLRCYEIIAWRPTSLLEDKFSSQPPRPMVGRAEELKVLKTAFLESVDGASRMVLLQGEAGIGKSRLLVEFIRGIQTEHRGPILEFQGTQYKARTGFHPVTDTLSQTVCQFQRDMSPEQRLAILQSVLNKAGLKSEDCRASFAELLGVPLPRQEGSQASVPSLRKDLILQNLTTVFRKQAGKKASVWIFNDLHWMDASTQEWVRQIAANPPPKTLVIFCSRPEGEVLEMLGESLIKLELKPLNEAEIRELAESVAFKKTLPDELIKIITQQTGGVPLFIEELTLALAGSKALKDCGSYYELIDPAMVAKVPANLNGLLLARLQKLREAKPIAQVCSVIGDEFELKHVASVLPPLLPQDIQGRIESLVAENILIRVESRNKEARFRFRHSLLKAAAYETMVNNARAAYHRRIAEQLRKGHWGEHHFDPGLVAHHLVEGGLVEESLKYWAQATERALALSTTAEAAAHAQSGLRAIADLNGGEGPARGRPA